ncbi:hypothetical protein E3J74_01515 [Candidatus Bathyarchaeota archaeon]|nr:MAG: hypothetical protein E3J74_01515 [Candidatus Bathyarchaeota archaeon]
MKSFKQLTETCFLNQLVEVKANVYYVKGRLLGVEPSTVSQGSLGNLLVEQDGRKLLIRGSAVQIIRRME